jgi:hypothetical protein
VVELISTFHLPVAGCSSHSQRVRRPLGPYEMLLENMMRTRKKTKIPATYSEQSRLRSETSVRVLQGYSDPEHLQISSWIQLHNCETLQQKNVMKTSARTAVQVAWEDFHTTYRLWNLNIFQSSLLTMESQRAPCLGLGSHGLGCSALPTWTRDSSCLEEQSLRLSSVAYVSSRLVFSSPLLSSLLPPSMAKGNLSSGVFPTYSSNPNS